VTRLPRLIPVPLLLTLVAGCTATPATSSGLISASASASPSPAVSSPPSTTPQLPFPVVSLPTQSLVELTGDLSPAALPGGTAIGTLPSGTQAIVEAGPREVEAATWYQLQWPPGGSSSRLAWVRVDQPSQLQSVEAPCPDASDGLLAMLAWDRVRCLGTSAVTVEGSVGHCQGGVVLVEPDWLGYACWAVSDGTSAMDIHADPASGIVFPDDIVRARLTGHFDDPVASTCVYLGDPDPLGQTPSAGEQVFLCREAFVVDTMEILEVIGPPPAA
jgi:hypothetical protein